jgi:hypothetical protein
MVHREGTAIARSTSVNGDRLGAPLGLEVEANVTVKNEEAHQRF